MSNLDLYTVAQVRQLDRQVIAACGITALQLMQRAADAAFAVLRRHWPQARDILLLCGAGNNGGDGYLLAAQALQAGLGVRVLALDEPPLDSVAAQARAIYTAAGGTVERADQDNMPEAADLYVDALFGSGLTRAVEGVAATLIERINASTVPIFALDVPSGIDADTGQVRGIAVAADLTLSFIAHKRGLFTGAALDRRGTLLLDTLDAPAAVLGSAAADARLIDLAELTPWLAPRRKDTHKGSFGHVLAIGGDHGTAGAIRLAAEATLRCGAGLVSVATRGEHVTALNAARPELMVRGVEDAQALRTLLPGVDTLALGPGLGQRAWGHALWHAALDAGKTQVIDADALNLLARQPRVFSSATVLTPHPGEAARLLGCSNTEVQHDRFAAARELARRFNAVVVLKGAGSLIAAPGGDVRICPWGNPGMAVGGMGDVLTGVVAALLAQGIPAWPAAQLGAALHAQAGDAAARDGERGLLASDLFAPLRRLCNPGAAA